MVRVGMAKQKQSRLIVFVCNIFENLLNDETKSFGSEIKFQSEARPQESKLCAARLTRAPQQQQLSIRHKKTSVIGGFFRWCSGTGSNRRHEDFQSSALPTELPEHRSTREFIKHIFGLVQLKIKLFKKNFYKFIIFINHNKKTLHFSMRWSVLTSFIFL